MSETLFNKVFRTRNGDSSAPITFLRNGRSGTAFNTQKGVAPEYYEGLITETGGATYNLDFLIPAGATIVWLSVYATALWTAGTSATLEVGDYSTAATPVEIDANGFFANVNLKATDLLAGESLTLLGGGQGGKAGAYSAGTNTHWTNLYSATARILRFSVVSSGAGTAGRTRCMVGFVHPAGVFRSV